MCNLGEGEIPRVMTECTPVARKAHKCCECGSVIDPGEQYECVKGLWDGQWLTFRTCSFCAATRRKAVVYLNDECPPFGGLWECMGMDYAAHHEVAA